MKRAVAGGVLASVVLASAVWSPSAWALDPGNYTVQCAPPRQRRDRWGDLRHQDGHGRSLDLKYTFGAVISGTRVDDGSRVILTGDRGCSLIEVRGRSIK